MKFSASIALIVFVGLVATSSALPARKSMVYVQQPAPYYGAPQRLMYMQYVQPGRTHARSTQAASALVAGDSVAAGSYLKDCDHAESDVAVAGTTVDDFAAESQQGEDVLSAAGAHGASSVAEAYPEAETAPEVQVQLNFNQAAEPQPAVFNDDAAKVPRDYNFEASEAAAVPEVSITADVPADLPAEVPAEAPLEASAEAAEAELPAPAPIAPVASPANRYLPAQNKKKVIIELDQSAEADQAASVAEDEEAEAAVEDDADAVEDEEELVPVAPKYPARVPNARRPVAKKPAKAAAGAAKPTKAPKPLPAGTFFPIEFGGTNGGAIAIANSFSTGEGGSATSHAIAYGSPDSVRARVRPSKFH